MAVAEHIKNFTNSFRRDKVESESSDNKVANESLELEKSTPASVISVQRNYMFNFNFASPKEMDELYYTVPEISRTCDLRGAAIIYQGQRVLPRNDSKEAKKFAGICRRILENSGGVNFTEQWEKNADLYGDGFVEMVGDENDEKITELAHIHPENFGYELEVVTDEENFTKQSRIKVDEETQKPVGYAIHQWNETDEVYENKKKIDKEKIAHLKYKSIGDSLYGVSLFQPAIDSVQRKLKIENSIEAAARLTAAPKLVLQGEFDTAEEAKEEAKEAASLDTNDVVVLNNGESFTVVNPGQISLPELREIFVVNITTATGVPRPILTSESSEINKATMQELMRQLREDMRSNMYKIKSVMENKIFKEIGKSYGINDIEKNLPILEFPQDNSTEEEVITREKRKAATLNSLSNNIQMLQQVMSETNDEDVQKQVKSLIDSTVKTYQSSIASFESLGRYEEEERDYDLSETVSLSADLVPETDEVKPSNTEDNENYFIDLSDNYEELTNPNTLKDKHDIVHNIYEQIMQGNSFYDSNENRIELSTLINKHNFYVGLMEKQGIIHELSNIGVDLDNIED